MDETPKGMNVDWEGRDPWPDPWGTIAFEEQGDDEESLKEI